MDRLFSPWRSKYIDTFSQQEDAEGKCILCKAYQENKDDEHFIIDRGKVSYVIMNLYPYNSGHLMIVPYRHISNLTELTEDESVEIMNYLKRMIRSLQTVSHPDGFNIGSNIGRTAGAGIDQHIHFHLVPRWNGDTNFMPVLGDTKMVSQEIREIMYKLRKTI